MAKSFVPSKNTQVWNAIVARLGKFDPPIDLTDYIDFKPDEAVKVAEYASYGIDFFVASQRREPFVQALRQARTDTGKKAFDEGKWKGALSAAKDAARDLASSITGQTSSDNWALDVSMKATKGIGFRQIWYYELTDRQLRLENVRPVQLGGPKLDSKFSALFNAPQGSVDLSSLHWSIGDEDPRTARSQCNVHVDQVGILANLSSGASITPDLAYHTLVELAFRTGLKGHLPGWMLQRVDFILPSSHENYALNFGTQIDVVNRDDLKLTLRGTCGFHNGGHEWAGTINLWGTHDVGGGWR